MRRSLKLMTFLALAGNSFSAFAQETDSGTTVSSWSQIMNQGGPVMLVLGIMSFLTLCLIFFYLFTLRSEVVVPSSLLKQLEEGMSRRDYELLKRICTEDGSAAARIIGAGVSIFIKSKKNTALVRNALEDEGARQAAYLWQRIQYLQDIAVIAPMVGLLGTVIGMIQSFLGMQAQDAVPRPTVIASGVSTALVTTAAGLILGIFAMIVYAYFRGRIQRLIGELETGCDRITVELLDPEA